MSERIQPFPGKVLIRLDPPDDTTKGGIIVPDIALEDSQLATVEAVSVVQEIPYLREGDRVLVGKYSGYDVTHDKEKFVIVKHSDILAKLVEEPVSVGG